MQVTSFFQYSRFKYSKNTSREIHGVYKNTFKQKLFNPLDRNDWKRYLNRILIEEEECIENPQTNELEVILQENDYRCQHIKNILKLDTGDTCRAGVIDKYIANKSVVTSLRENSGLTLNIGSLESLQAVAAPADPKIDLVLAVPRPLRLERILPVISCLG